MLLVLKKDSLKKIDFADKIKFFMYWTLIKFSRPDLKVRENKPKIMVVVHNTFRFDFYFLLKRLRTGVWRTRDICIGGKNPTD